MTKKIVLSTLAAAMVASSALAGTLELSSDYNIALEVVDSPEMYGADNINIGQVIRDATYTAAIANGGSLNQPSMKFGLAPASDGMLVLSGDNTQSRMANIPAFCYGDPSQPDAVWSPVTVYDHTDDVSGLWIFKQVSQNVAVSDNNAYKLMELDLKGDTTCNGPTSSTPTEFNATAEYLIAQGCGLNQMFQLELWDANNQWIGNYVDQAISSEFFNVIREYTVTLQAKTFGDIKLEEHVEGVEEGNIQDDIGYYVYPHDTPIVDLGVYNYYGDLMGTEQSADPMAWHADITDGLDYRYQDLFDGNDVMIESYTEAMWGPDYANINNGNYEVFPWYTDTNFNISGDCYEGASDFYCMSETTSFVGGESENLGHVFPFNMGLDHAAIVTPADFYTSIWVVDPDYYYTSGASAEARANGYDYGMYQVWPMKQVPGEGQGCPLDEPAGHTGYWQWGGYHAVIPGVSASASNPSVIKVYNGLVQDHTDRINTALIDGGLGYDNQTNIEQAASVYFRLIDDNGNVATVTGWDVDANSALAITAGELLTAAQVVNADFGVAKPKFKAEIFVNNAPKDVTVLAIQVKDKGDIVLPVYTHEVARQHASF